MDPETLESIINPEANTVSEDVIKANPLACSHCDYVAETEMGLRAHQKKHKKGIVEVEEAKHKKEKYETNIAEIPSDYDRLSSLLQSFGVPNHRGIIEGMKLYNISDINALKDLLRNVSTPQGKSEAVIRVWSEMQGLRLTGNTQEQQSIIKKPDAIDDLFSQQERMLRMKMLENMVGQNNGSKPNPELEAIKLQMASMQEQNKRLESLLTQQKVENEINLLKKAVEDNRKEYGGQMGSLNDSMKDFVSNLMNSQEKMALQNDNKFEKLLLQMQHKTEVDELKKEILAATNSKPLQEKMMDKVESLANNVAMGTGKIFETSLKGQESLERVNSALALTQSGFNPEQISTILNPQQKLSVPSARIEFENLAKLTTELEKETHPQPEPPKTDYSKNDAVKFNASDN